MLLLNRKLNLCNEKYCIQYSKLDPLILFVFQKGHLKSFFEEEDRLEISNMIFKVVSK